MKILFKLQRCLEFAPWYFAQALFTLISNHKFVLPFILPKLGTPKVKLSISFGKIFLYELLQISDLRFTCHYMDLL